jgi:hypothetical protein
MRLRKGDASKMVIYSLWEMRLRKGEYGYLQNKYSLWEMRLRKGDASKMVIYSLWERNAFKKRGCFEDGYLLFVGNAFKKMKINCFI